MRATFDSLMPADSDVVEIKLVLAWLLVRTETVHTKPPPADITKLRDTFQSLITSHPFNSSLTWTDLAPYFRDWTVRDLRRCSAYVAFDTQTKAQRRRTFSKSNPEVTLPRDEAQESLERGFLELKSNFKGMFDNFSNQATQSFAMSEFRIWFVAYAAIYLIPQDQKSLATLSPSECPGLEAAETYVNSHQVGMCL